MKLSFTTLACPNWDVQTIVRNAVSYGYQAVDFRGTKYGIDVTTQDDFCRELANTKRLLNDSGLIVSGISSSIRVAAEDCFSANVEEANRTIPLALELGAKQVRVFGYGDPVATMEHRLDQSRRCMDTICELDGADHIEWVLETHDSWIDSKVCRQMVGAVGRVNFRLLWDIGHTTRVGMESPGETLEEVGDLISSVHIKDAVFDKDHPYAMKDGWRYVLPGKGELPLGEAVKALREASFDGWYLFEHEKRWHAELEDPEVALPAYVQWMKSFSD